jgi:hypothetical protein
MREAIDYNAMCIPLECAELKYNCMFLPSVLYNSCSAARRNARSSNKMEFPLGDSFFYGADVMSFVGVEFE